MVFEAIAELVAERVEKDVSEITMDSKFQDLGIEGELDQKVETVGDLVAFIESKQA